MTRLAPSLPSEPARRTVSHDLGRVEAGVLGPDDRVELREGVVVAMAPQNPPHAVGVARALGARAGYRGRSGHG
jgi:hypothetical protein